MIHKFWFDHMIKINSCGQTELNKIIKNEREIHINNTNKNTNYKNNWR